MQVKIGDKVKELIGMDGMMGSIVGALSVNHPVLLYGPTGSGKTMIAWAAAQRYSEETGLPVIYLQLYPEMTKNSLIGGETLKDGSIVIETQPIISFGCKGAIFIVDECTHTTEPVLLAFNSLIEEPYSTVIGHDIYTMHKDTRIIFCGNYPDHAGNIALPISFANRLHIEKVELPDVDTLVKIGASVSPKLCKEVIEFIAKLVEKTHEPTFPISPRNVIVCCEELTSLMGCRADSEDDSNVPSTLRGYLRADKISPEMFRKTVMSTMMAHIKSKSTGPDKIGALLWDGEK